MSEPDLDASQGDNELTLSSYWSSQLDPNGLGSFPESKLHDVAAHVGIPSDGISGFIELFEKGEEGRITRQQFMEGMAESAKSFRPTPPSSPSLLVQESDEVYHSPSRISPVKRQTEVAITPEQLEKLKNDLANSEAKVHALETQVTVQLSQLQSAHDSVDSLDRELGELKAKVVELEYDNRNKAAEIKEQATALATATRNLDSAKADQSTLKEQLEATTKRAKEMQEELEKAQSQIRNLSEHHEEDLKRQKSQYETSLQQTKGDLLRVSQQKEKHDDAPSLQDLIVENRVLRERYAATDESYKKLKMDVLGIQAELDELRKDNATMQSVITPPTSAKENKPASTGRTRLSERSFSMGNKAGSSKTSLAAQMANAQPPGSSPASSFQTTLTSPKSPTSSGGVVPTMSFTAATPVMSRSASSRTPSTPDSLATSTSPSTSPRTDGAALPSSTDIPVKRLSRDFSEAPDTPIRFAAALSPNSSTKDVRDAPVLETKENGGASKPNDDHLKIKKLEQTIMTRDATIQDLEDQVAQLHDELKQKDVTFRQETDMLTKQNSQLLTLANDNRLQHLEKQLATVTAERDELSATKKDLSDENQHLSEESRKLHNKIQEMESAATEASKQAAANLAALQSTLDAERAALGTLTTLAQDKEQYLKSQLATTQQSLEEAKQSITQLESDKISASQSHGDKVDQLLSQITSLQLEADALRQQKDTEMAKQAAERDQMEADLKKLQAEHANGADTLRNLQEENSKLASNLSDANAELQTLREAALHAQDDQEESDAEITKLQKSLDDTSAQLDDKEAELQQALGEISKLENQHQEMSAQKEALEADHLAQLRHVEDLETQLATIKEQLSTSEGNLSKVTANMAIAEAELNELKREKENQRLALHNITAPHHSTLDSLFASHHFEHGDGSSASSEPQSPLHDESAPQAESDQDTENLEDLQSALQDKEAEISKLREELQAMEGTREQESARLQEASDQLRDAMEQLMRSENKLAEAEHKLLETQRQLQALEEASTNEKNALQQQLDQVRAEHASQVDLLQQSHQSHQGKLISLQEELERSKHDHVTTKERLDAETARLNQALGEAKRLAANEIQSLTNSLEAEKSTSSILKQAQEKQAKEHDRITSGLNAQLADVNAQLAAVNENSASKVGASAEKERELTKKLTEMTERYQQASKALDGLRGTLERMKGDTEQKLDRIPTDQQWMTEKENETANLKQLVADASSQVRDLQRQIKQQNSAPITSTHHSPFSDQLLKAAVALTPVLVLAYIILLQLFYASDTLTLRPS